MFGIDVQELAKKEVLKVDVNKNGTPDVLEALDAFQAGVVKVEPFLSRIDRAYARRFLAAINFDHVASDKELDEAAEGIELVIKVLPVLKAASENLEADLKKGSKK